MSERVETLLTDESLQQDAGRHVGQHGLTAVDLGFTWHLVTAVRSLSPTCNRHIVCHTACHNVSRVPVSTIGLSDCRTVRMSHNGGITEQTTRQTWSQLDHKILNLQNNSVTQYVMETMPMIPYTGVIFSFAASLLLDCHHFYFLRGSKKQLTIVITGLTVQIPRAS